MAHAWSDLVVGGVSNPRVLVVGENFCSNNRASTDLTGWTKSSSSLGFSLISDSNAYSENMFRMLWQESLKEYVEYQATFDKTLAAIGKIVVNFRIKDESLSANEQAVGYVELRGNSKVGSREVVYSKKIKRLSIIFDGIDKNENSLVAKLRIYTGTDFRTSGDVRFDDVYINEAIEDYQFECPNDTFLEFQKEVTGELPMSDGKVNEYNKRWRPTCYSRYYAMNKSDEIRRQRIAEASLLFIQPHIDFLWGFFAKWKNNFKRSYSFKRYNAHDSEISLYGNEFMIDTIHPAEAEYNPAPDTYILTIGTNYDSQVGTLITVSPTDQNGFKDGTTPFSREFESGESVTLIAPSSIVVDGETRNFTKWIDKSDDSTLSTSVTYNFTLSAELEVEAVYEVDEVSSGGYGTGYGSSPYGDRL